MPPILNRLLQVARSVAFLVMAILPMMAPIGHADENDAFRQALRGITDERLLTFLKNQSQKWVTLTMLKNIEIGVEPNPDPQEVTTAIDAYDAALIPYWHYRWDVLKGREECKRFMEADLHLNNTLLEAIDEFREPGATYFFQLRDRARIEIMNRLAAGMDEMVAEGMTAGQKATCIPDEVDNCALPACFGTLEKEWKDRHAVRAQARETAVADVIGYTGLWNETHLRDELHRNYERYKNYERAFNIGAMVWDTAVLLLGPGEIAAGYGLLEGVGLFGRIVFSGVTMAPFVIYFTRPNKSLPRGTWDSLVIGAEVFSHSNLFGSAEMIPTSAILGPIDTLTENRLRIDHDLRANPGVQRRINEAVKAYGSEEAAYAQLPTIQTRVQLTLEEARSRKLQIPADLLTNPVPNPKERTP